MGNITSYQRICKECHRLYTNEDEEWCKPCQISELEKNFIRWTDANEKIDNLSQEVQVKVDNPPDIVFEGIPYDHYNDIEMIADGRFAQLYSGIWEDGPLNYNTNEYKYIRSQNMKVNLKYFSNSQNITDEFLNKV